MNRQPVSSSSIVSIGHDSDANELHVEFTNGGVYVFSDVTADHHAALMGTNVADGEEHSIGRHFAKHIRGRFPFSKLKPEKDERAEE